MVRWAILGRESCTACTHGRLELVCVAVSRQSRLVIKSYEKRIMDGIGRFHRRTRSTGNARVTSTLLVLIDHTPPVDKCAVGYIICHCQLFFAAPFLPCHASIAAIGRGPYVPPYTVASSQSPEE